MYGKNYILQYFASKSTKIIIFKKLNKKKQILKRKSKNK